MTEAEARTAILSNGYVVMIERDRCVTVWEPWRGSGRQWSGVNYLDLVESFNLHTRPTKRPKKKRATR